MEEEGKVDVMQNKFTVRWTSSKLESIKVMVQVNGAILEMEVDTWTSYTIVSDSTYNGRVTTLHHRDQQQTVHVYKGITGDPGYNHHQDAIPRPRRGTWGSTFRWCWAKGAGSRLVLWNQTGLAETESMDQIEPAHSKNLWCVMKWHDHLIKDELTLVKAYQPRFTLIHELNHVSISCVWFPMLSRRRASWNLTDSLSMQASSSHNSLPTGLFRLS